MTEMDDIVKDFLVESHENLDRLDSELVALEARPDDRAVLGSIFRTIHTIKGTCGFLGLSKLEAVTHVGESLLCLLRDGDLLMTPDIASGLLALVDAVRRILGHVEDGTGEGQEDWGDLIRRLEKLQGVAHEPAPRDRIGEILVETGEASAQQVAAALGAQLAGDPRPIGELLVGRGAVDADAVADSLKIQAEIRGSAVADNNVRVDVNLLDKLMNLVGELVLARNELLQHTETNADSTLVATSQRLNLITTELQEGVMKTRMQPIGTIWNKFPRMIRDLGLACGKQVRIEMEGAETELDRTICEAIKDPLTHLLRNSVDHGIEAPEARVRKGKPAVGLLTLRAQHEGGQVNIEITDDGAGIDPAKIRDKSIARGLITRDQAARMSERELVNLIFQPGFSTAEQVTNISGRGVGMDVVRANIERIGGSVDVQSQPGHGATVRMKIPLTLAIIPALVVTSGGERFAIPQANLVELVRLDGSGKGLEHIRGVPVYRLRGQLMPIVHLNRALGLDDPADEDPSLTVVVVQADERQFGLVVDEVNDTQEIVVKPLGKQLKGMTCFAGATIMGDGRVALILDVLGIAQHAGVSSAARRGAPKDDRQQTAADAGERRSFLLFGLGDERRLALPLGQVARLEEFPRASIERAAGRRVVQYRQRIMPLVDLADHLGGSTMGTGDKLQVVVHAGKDRCVGLVVGQIEDVVEDTVRVERQGADDYLLGSAVIQGRVTDLLDVEALIGAVDPSLRSW